MLDFVAGGPVPFLYPLVETGVGLRYPVQIVFGRGPLGATLDGPITALRVLPPDQSNHTYGFIQGYGVANVLLSVTIYAGDRWNGWKDFLTSMVEQ